MKRSKAIEKLTDDLMCYYDDPEVAEFYAKSFLSSVESLGMLPPCHCNIDDQDLTKEQLSEMSDGWSSSFRWEEEE